MDWRALSIIQGWPDTRETLGKWRARPVPVLAPWLLLSLLIGIVLLLLVWQVGVRSPPDPTRPEWLPGDPYAGRREHMLQLLRNNLTVLALHSTACFAGYVVHVALESTEEGMLAHTTRAVAVIAVMFVPFATILSIATQAWVLGAHASTVSRFLGIDVATLLRTALPHTLVELTAIFLPLAAWMVIRFRAAARQLLAATIVATCLALPMLLFAAYVEAYTWDARVRSAVAAQIDQLPRGASSAPLGTYLEDPTDGFSATLDLRLAGIVGEPEGYATYDAALAAARSQRPDTVVALIRGEDSIELRDVQASRTPGVCESEASMPGTKRALTFETLGDARTVDGTLLERAGVLALVDGERSMTPTMLQLDGPRPAPRSCAGR